MDQSILRVLLLVTMCIMYECGPLKENCRWSDNGQEFDLSSLHKGNGWKIKDSNDDSGVFSMDYLFQFCGNLEKKCKGQEVGAFEALEVMGQLTDTCEILGRFSQQTIQQVDNGIKITYKHGDICTNSENPADNNQPRKINFVVQCGTPAPDETWVKSKINSDTVTKCNLEFTMHSVAGCRIGSSVMESIKQLLMYMLLGLCIYFIVGVMYNRKVKETQGLMESVPHLHFWQQVPGYVNQGFWLTFHTSKQATQALIAKARGQQPSSPFYSTSNTFANTGYNVV